MFKITTIFLLLFFIFNCGMNMYTSIILLTQKNLVQDINTKNTCYIGLPLNKYKLFGLYYVIMSIVAFKSIYEHVKELSS